ncbi:hypothetical protein OC846_004226 [Tilletia horrida]|uniref:Transmembrane protein n=1 Tax=Tilletia horrida TaxID=155126 RepID=A0AAN6GN06_9BASI|nr:hypothetical protein OC845_005396 [Tilletia horrida]KAK0549069.1 hypothetical protein OC846_004226 [Tilletia horrida]KAK0564650.1 hypothetical protein OC861_004179 [Tilletia horrida]
MSSGSGEPTIFDANPEVLQLLGLFEQFKAVIYVQLGIVIWEYLTTAPWEWSVLTGRRPFRKPMIIFFLARYSMWLAIIPNLIQLRTTHHTSCRSVFNALTVGATFQVVFGQLVFVLRCLAIWEWSPWVISIFIAELLPYVGFSFAIFAGTTIGTAPDLTPGYISCQISNYNWPFIAAYSLCALVDLTTASLMVWKVMSIRNTMRSSLLNMFLREGLMYSALGLVPAIVVLAYFGNTKNGAVRGAGLTLCSLLHAILGCRAFISLDSYAERLPLGLQARVKNGEMLDADTLARIAFHTGLPPNPPEELAPEPPGRGKWSDGPGGGLGDLKSKLPWSIRLARIGQKKGSPHSDEKGFALKSSGSGDHPSSANTFGASGFGGAVGGGGGGMFGASGGGQFGGGGGLSLGAPDGHGLGRTSSYTIPPPPHSGPGSLPIPRHYGANLPGGVQGPNLDGIVISEQQVVEEESDAGSGQPGFLTSPMNSWDQHTGQMPSRLYGASGPGLGPRDPPGTATTGGTGVGHDSMTSFEVTELKEDLKRNSPM